MIIDPEAYSPAYLSNFTFMTGLCAARWMLSDNLTNSEHLMDPHEIETQERCEKMWMSSEHFWRGYCEGGGARLGFQDDKYPLFGLRGTEPLVDAFASFLTEPASPGQLDVMQNDDGNSLSVTRGRTEPYLSFEPRVSLDLAISRAKKLAAEVAANHQTARGGGKNVPHEAVLLKLELRSTAASRVTQIIFKSHGPRIGVFEPELINRIVAAGRSSGRPPASKESS